MIKLSKTRTKKDQTSYFAFLRMPSFTFLSASFSLLGLFFRRRFHVSHLQSLQFQLLFSLNRPLVWVIFSGVSFYWLRRDSSVTQVDRQPTASAGRLQGLGRAIHTNRPTLLNKVLPTLCLIKRSV